jgi:hypothetical protein
VRDCKARGAICDIKLGDARLTLADELTTARGLSGHHRRDGRAESAEQKGTVPLSESGFKTGPVRYHILVLDAFSGDAIPTHLLTVEAFEIYLRRLTTEKVDAFDGVIAAHVSNRYLNLERVVRGVAERMGVEMVEIVSPRIPEKSINAAKWIFISRNKSVLAELRKSVVDPTTIGPPVVWTDAHSSLFEIVK